GTIVPSLLGVAAYLCTEEYSDPARSAVLERLAAGVRPIVLALTGLLEWADVLAVEELLEGRRSPYGEPIRPIRGGAPVAPAPQPAPIDLDAVEPFVGDWPRDKTRDERRADFEAIGEWFRANPDRA